jgi:hypothetical protein
MFSLIEVVAVHHAKVGGWIVPERKRGWRGFDGSREYKAGVAESPATSLFLFDSGQNATHYRKRFTTMTYKSHHHLSNNHRRLR